MKRLLSMTLAAVISTTAVTSTALAQPYPPGPPPGYGRPPGPGPGHGWHRWHRGDRFHGNRYVVNDWQRYRLGPPPPGYQWVRNGGEFVLIGITSGIVASIILNSQYH